MSVMQPVIGNRTPYLIVHGFQSHRGSVPQRKQVLGVRRQCSIKVFDCALHGTAQTGKGGTMLSATPESLAGPISASLRVKCTGQSVEQSKRCGASE